MVSPFEQAEHLTLNDLVRAFLAAKFTGEERHRRRVAKIEALERRYQTSR
jgi:ribose 5-phosphate isomerase RpiB